MMKNKTFKSLHEIIKDFKKFANNIKFNFICQNPNCKNKTEKWTKSAGFITINGKYIEVCANCQDEFKNKNMNENDKKNFNNIIKDWDRE